MNKLTKRLDRILRLRNMAIEDRNFAKKYQAERLIRVLTNKINSLSHFSIN
jgi:hypothetical protein